MSTTFYTAAYKCDRCGKEAEGSRWDWQAQSTPPPDGWLVRLEFLRVTGITIRDLCDDCAGLPVRQIAQEMRSEVS